jgi:ketol-acid reductoisomerase
MTTVYLETDGDPGALSGKTLGIVGYGPLGRSMALNLAENGVAVLASGADAAQVAQAQADGIALAGAAVVAQRADVLLLLLPDELMPAIYMEHISPHLTRGDTLLFSSGYNVAFGYIEPPPFVDVGLIAPRAQGEAVRAAFLNGEGVLSFVAVAQDASRRAWDTLLAVAAAAGLLRAGAVEVSIEQEAELNLFIRQAIIPAFHHVMLTAANLLMRVGYPAEAALADLYVSGKFSDYLRQADLHGLLAALEGAALPDQYAAYSRLGRFSELKLERLMEVTLDEIRGGAFAKEWSREYADGFPHLSKLRKFQRSLDLWDWEQQTLDLLKGPR